MIGIAIVSKVLIVIGVLKFLEMGELPKMGGGGLFLKWGGLNHYDLHLFRCVTEL